MEALNEQFSDETTKRAISSGTALGMDGLIQKLVLDQGKPIIDWQDKSNITGKVLIQIGDYLIDEIRDKYSVQLEYDEIDNIAERCIDVAKRRYK
jgi:type I restriction enzyme R subunit